MLAAVVCWREAAAGAEGHGPRNEAAQPTASPRIPVEVWRGGCCLPTLRLRDALEDAFARAPAFIHPAPHPAPENLVVYISDSVRLETTGDRSRAVYRIEFRAGSTTGRLLRSSKGSCWYDEMRVCTTRIVEDARKAARRLG